MRLSHEKILQSLRFELSHSLSRKYPFGDWFRWSVNVGFIVLLVFFTLFNLATTGYALQPSWELEPNKTEAVDYWFNSWFFTWGDDALEPRCQEQEVLVGSQFMTTNLGLTYTVKAIKSIPAHSDLMVQHPSLSYHNNVLQNCKINQVALLLRKADQSIPPSKWWSWNFNYATVDAQCEVLNKEGLFTMTFQTEYKDILSKTYGYVVKDDYKTRTSVWWGTRLLDVYFNGVQTLMADVVVPQTTGVANGQLDYFPGPDTNLIRNYTLFYPPWFYFLYSNGAIINQDDYDTNPATMYNNETETFSRPLTEGNFFARIFYSLVLVDLGQSDTQNLLLDADMLKYVLDPDDDFNRYPGGPLNNGTGLDWWHYRAITPPDQPNAIENNSVPMDQAYEAFQDPKYNPGQLGTHEASIYSQYTCSVPKRRGLATVVLLVAVADFVLLQTAILILKLIANRVVEGSDPYANYCEGCVEKRQEHRDNVPLVSTYQSLPGHDDAAAQRRGI